MGDKHALRLTTISPAHLGVQVVRQELRGDAGEAAQALEKVVALVPSDANAHYNLAVSHLQMADNLVSPLNLGSGWS